MTMFVCGDLIPISIPKKALDRYIYIFIMYIYYIYIYIGVTTVLIQKGHICQSNGYTDQTHTLKGPDLKGFSQTKKKT